MGWFLNWVSKGLGRYKLGGSCYLNQMFNWKPEMVKNKTFFKWSQDVYSSIISMDNAYHQHLCRVMQVLEWT